MESAPLLVLAASLGVTVGWQPLESDPSRYELIVATPPAVVERLDEIDLAQLVAEVPPDIAPIGRVRVIATDQPAPREQLVTLLKPVIESPQVDGEPLGDHIQLTQYGAPGPSNARQAAAPPPPRTGFDPYAAAGARPPSVAPPGTTSPGTVPPPAPVATAPTGATFSGSAPPPGMYGAPAPAAGLPPGQPGLYAPPPGAGGFGAGNVAYDPARMAPVAAPTATSAPNAWSQPAPSGSANGGATPYAAAPSDSVAAALQGPPSAGPPAVAATPATSGANGQYPQPRYGEGAPLAAAPVTSGPPATWGGQPPQVAQVLDDFGRRTQEMLDNLGRTAGSAVGGVVGAGSAPSPVGAPPTGGGFAGASGAPGSVATVPARTDRLDQPIANQQVGQWSTQGTPAASAANGLPSVNGSASLGAPADPRLRPPTGGADATSGGLSGPQFPGNPGWPSDSTRPTNEAGARPSLFDNNLAPGGTPAGDRLVPEINYGMLSDPPGAPLINGADGRPLPSSGGSPWGLQPPPLPTTTPTSGGAAPAGGAAGVGTEANPSVPSVTTPPAATAAGQDPSNLFAVLLAWVLLCGSAAGNLYLFWSYLDVRTKYRSLVRESARGLARRFSAA